jgi:N utilization substance protein B
VSAASSRRRSREAALQVLYAVDVKGRGERPGASPEEAFERASAHFELPEGARAFAKELCCGVAEHRDDLDRRLAAHSEHWRLDRMATVDRNVLRLAAYEILHAGTPPSVAIDEAVELARRFGGERSPGFVNGILDALAREASA